MLLYKKNNLEAFGAGAEACNPKSCLKPEAIGWEFWVHHVRRWRHERWRAAMVSVPTDHFQYISIYRSILKDSKGWMSLKLQANFNIKFFVGFRMVTIDVQRGIRGDIGDCNFISLKIKKNIFAWKLSSSWPSIIFPVFICLITDQRIRGFTHFLTTIISKGGRRSRLASGAIVKSCFQIDCCWQRGEMKTHPQQFLFLFVVFNSKIRRLIGNS